jgi:hypothetical protein
MRTAIKQTIIEHATIDTDTPYLTVVARIESELARLDDSYRALLHENKISELRERLEKGAEPNGLMLHYVAPHGAWLALVDRAQEGVVYQIGNVSMAVQMTQHVFSAGLYAPLRVAVYPNKIGGTSF